MKETTQPPKDPKKKLWIGYAVILAIVILSNLFLFPAVMQASVKSVNYSTFLQMLESKELATVQIEDQQIYFVDKNDNSYKTNAIAQDNNLVTRLEDAGVEFGTVYQSPTIWDSLLNLLNLQDEDGASTAASAEKLLHLTNEKFNLLMVGATGSGKSSTINALFDTQVAEVGTGVDPETASIDCYALDNFCIWDTPGLGDGVENDIAIAKAIKAKLSETDPEGAQVVDMVLIVLDASTKDLGTVYTLLNEVVIPRLGSEAEQRILIGLNQSDMAMKGRHWDEDANTPDEVLQDFLDRKADSVQQRIREATGLNLNVVCYCAGYTEEDEQRKPYNLAKLLHCLLAQTPKEKRLTVVQHLNEDPENWVHNEDDDYRRRTLSDVLETILTCIGEGADDGSDIGQDLLGIPGGVIGGLVGGIGGAVVAKTYKLVLTKVPRQKSSFYKNRGCCTWNFPCAAAPCFIGSEKWWFNRLPVVR